MNKKPKIIIDTDPGHDDALAIMLLVKSRMFETLAITTVAGNSTIQNVTSNARFLLDLLESRTPIYSGAEKPLKKAQVLANVHGKSGLAGANVTKQEKLTGDAVDQIIRLVRSNPNEVSLVVLGPQTNIAKAFLKDPQMPNLIKQLIIMGGAIDVPGNKSRVSEFNLFVDPDAAKVVFDASVKKVLVPLDICNTMPLFLEDFEKITGRLRNSVLSMMKHFIKGIEKFEFAQGALVYDALAAYYMVRPDAYEIEEADIRIETKGELTEGMSVKEKRVYAQKDNNVSLVTKIDREMFVRDFLNILSS